MPDFSSQPTLPPLPWYASGILRGAVATAIIAALFWVGMDTNAVIEAIERFWQHLLSLAGLATHAAALQQGVSGLVTTRSLVSVLTYSLLYTGACVVLLAIALRTPDRIRLALLLYAAVFITCAVLVVLGKLAGNAAWAYKLARRLIDFIVSPLPVLILIPLLRWYQPAGAAAGSSAAEQHL